MSEAVKLEIRGGEARLTLCRPNSGNALRMQDIVEARAAITDAGKTAGVRVLRIRAEGDVFCAGRAHEPSMQPDNLPEALQTVLVQPILELYASLYALDITSIAEVQGDAHGLGCGLVAACDLAVATNAARFSLPEMQKNLPPTLALSALGPKVHPKAVAHLVLGALTLDAAGALAAGLVGEIVIADALATRVDEIVRGLVSYHALAIKTVKRYMRVAVGQGHEANSVLAAALLSGAMVDIRADALRPKV